MVFSIFSGRSSRRREPPTKGLGISFPKSGRTWLRVMLDQADVPLTWDHAGSGHSKARRFEEIDFDLAATPRRTLFLHRGPLDTVVSGYHQASKRVGNFDGTISEFVRDPRHGLEKIARFNLEWIGRMSTRDDAIVVLYEDLRRSGVDELGRVLRFFGSDLSDDEIEALLEANSFDRMKEREVAGAADESYGTALKAADVTDPNSFKVRRGKVGGYRDELSAEDVAWGEALLEELDYDARVHRSRA